MSTTELLELKYVRPYHREIARRLILGESNKEISERLGISVSRLSVIIGSPLFKRELRRLENARDKSAIDVTKSIRELAPIALECIERTMYKGSPTLSFEAAKTILDRAGYTPVNKTAVKIDGEVKHNYHELNDNEIKELLKKRLEMMRKKEKDEETELAQVADVEVEFDKVENDRSISEQSSQKGLLIA